MKTPPRNSGKPSKQAIELLRDAEEIIQCCVPEIESSLLQKKIRAFLSKWERP